MSDAVGASVSRNSLCPCGSGRRYKACHGALGVAAAAISAPRLPSRSAYRAPGGEWAHLDEETRDLLGAQMERALAMQMAGRIDEGAREYREVIAIAANTHDALHMLGVIELGRGNLDEAERLISAAILLRPPYAAIEHNWQLVQDARLALARAHPEQLAERALPILVDLALAPGAAGRPGRASGPRTAASAPPTVHLIGRVHAGDHDDGWLLRWLADLLGADATTLWATDGDGTEAIGARRIQRVDGGIGAIPRGGTHVFVGVDFDCAAWIDRADAERVIVFCQAAAPTRYLEQLRAIARDGARPLELVFASQAMAKRFGCGHSLLPPPLDLAAPMAALAPEHVVYDEWLIETPPAWPCGIIGQNQQFLGEPPDLDSVKTLARIAGRLHIYDPGRFRYVLGGSPITRFFERRPGGLQPFLAQLGCFVHRTQAWWQDTAGRELYGAMALGVPVLCPRGSIHAERIEHGVDGLLYGSIAEAQQHLSDLRRAPALAAAIGRAGRNTVRALFEGETLARRYRELILGAADNVAGRP
jgi:hypothetical protein